MLNKCLKLGLTVLFLMSGDMLTSSGFRKSIDFLLARLNIVRQEVQVGDEANAHTGGWSQIGCSLLKHISVAPTSRLAWLTSVQE